MRNNHNQMKSEKVPEIISGIHKEKERGAVKTFTSEERNLMCLYNSGTRLELIENLTDMRGYLQADETELLSLTDCVLEKLRQMNDQEFSALDLYPDFMD